MYQLVLIQFKRMINFRSLKKLGPLSQSMKLCIKKFSKKSEMIRHQIHQDKVLLHLCLREELQNISKLNSFKQVQRSKHSNLLIKMFHNKSWAFRNHPVREINNIWRKMGANFLFSIRIQTGLKMPMPLKKLNIFRKVITTFCFDLQHLIVKRR